MTALMRTDIRRPRMSQTYAEPKAEKRAVMLRQETVMAAINVTKHCFLCTTLTSHTNNERVDACLTGLDLFHRNVLSEHPFDERRLDLVASNDSLAITKHGIPQRC